MNVLNHMLVGVTVSYHVQLPQVAIPMALFSHYALDAVPHFGYKKGGYEEALRHRLTYLVVCASVLASFILSFHLAVSGALIQLVCAGAAILPDLIAVLEFYKYEKKGQKLPRLLKVHSIFHSTIQRYERPWALIIEINLVCALGLYVMSIK